MPSQATLRRVKVPKVECPDHFMVCTWNPAATLSSQRIAPSGLLIDYTPVTGARGVVAVSYTHLTLPTKRIV